MNLNYLIKTHLQPKLKATVKAVVRPAERIEISVPKFIELWGPSKIQSFISIGANDGVKNDPLVNFIEKNKWQGILVEPFPENFDKLTANLGYLQSLKFENVGIVEKAGIYDFFYIKDITAADPDWYPQISSFDRETFYRNIEGEKEIDNRVGVTQIKGISFDDLAAKYSLNQVDLIMIDTEGYDYKILSTINLTRYNPKIVVFEYEWLTTHEVKKATRQLKEAGYRVVFGAFDCIAVKN